MGGEGGDLNFQGGRTAEKRIMKLYSRPPASRKGKFETKRAVFQGFRNSHKSCHRGRKRGKEKDSLNKYSKKGGYPPKEGASSRDPENRKRQMPHQGEIVIDY